MVGAAGSGFWTGYDLRLEFMLLPRFLLVIFPVQPRAPPASGNSAGLRHSGLVIGHSALVGPPSESGNRPPLCLCRVLLSLTWMVQAWFLGPSVKLRDRLDRFNTAYPSRAR